MAKRRVGRYPKAFKPGAVERLNQCENIVALSQELGVPRRLLYTWREQLEPVERSEGPAANARESTLRKEVSQLKRLLADKTLEVDYFTGALHTVEARRKRSGQAGAQASTPTYGT
jgi:transposase-like protein